MYPTKEEIMNKKTTLLKEEIEYFKKWKNSHWKIAKRCQVQKELFKTLALQFLIKEICLIHRKSVPQINLNPIRKTASYNSKKNFITLNNTSIITALHELGHHLYGKDELLACAYSVHLFKIVFPMAFKKLRWEGHTLISTNKIERKPKK